MVFAAALSDTERGALRNRVLAEPDLHVIQLQTALATTPAFEAGGLHPRSLVTRCFATASAEEVVVMPGGFSRLPVGGDLSRGLSRTRNGVCKDTWIIADPDEAHLIRWPRGDVQPGVAVRESLPSRAAESLYWVGRYAEQAEFSARVARALVDRLFSTGDAHPGDRACTERLLEALSEGSGVARADGADAETPEAYLARFAGDGAQMGSLAWLLAATSRNANRVRDRWSSDSWRIMDDLLEQLESPPQEQTRFGADPMEDIAQQLDAVVDSLLAFAGMTSESMTQEDGFRFLIIGRRVERCRWVLLLLRQMTRVADDAEERALLDALLDCCESRITHRRRNRASISVENVFETLVLDELNPRSVAYQLIDLVARLDSLPRPDSGRGLRSEQRDALAASTRVRLAESALVCMLEDGERPYLAEFCDSIDAHVHAVDAGLLLTYFSHVKPRQMAPVVTASDETP